MARLAILGGTGPEGRGLALRFAAAGEAVAVGSRDPARAEAAAADIRLAVPGADVTAGENIAVLGSAAIAVLAVPFAGLAPLLERSAATLDGKLVIDVIVPVALRSGLFELLPVPGAPSVGELIQAAVPRARVVSAFKNLSAKTFVDLGTPLEGDVVVCTDDESARGEVITLVHRLAALRAVDGGALANGRYSEAVSVLLLNLNRRHHARTSIRIIGL